MVSQLLTLMEIIIGRYCLKLTIILLFVIETIAPNTYVMSTPISIDIDSISSVDEYNVKDGAVGDIDEDGRDEFYIVGMVSGNLYVVVATEGVNAQNLNISHVYFLMNTTTEMHR